MSSSALRLSLGANLVLASLVAVLLLLDPASTPTPVAPENRPPFPRSAAEDRALNAPSAQATAIQISTRRAAFAQLEQSGVSRDVIANAVLGDYHRRWDREFSDLEKRHAPRRVPEREYIELGRLRDAGQIQALKEVLGDAGYLAWDRERTLNVLNPGGVGLTPEEAERVYRLQKEFDEHYLAMQMAVEDGVADGADSATLYAQARQELEREFVTLLGQERFDQMRGVSDPVSDVYRTFADLSPTPDQAAAVVQVDDEFRRREAALADRMRAHPDETANLARALQAMSETREADLRRIFGAEAYEVMKRENDSTFQRLEQFAVAWELNDQEIAPVYETLRAFHEEASRTRAAAAMREAAGQRVNWQEVNAAIEQTRQQTETGLETLLGSSRLWRLKENGLLASR